MMSVKQAAKVDIKVGVASEGSTVIGVKNQIGWTTADVEAFLEKQRQERETDVWNGVVPYRGLAAYRQNHGDYFFGREDLVEKLLQWIKETNFITLAGPSGSGKSSVARAGLLYALSEGRLDNSETWKLATMQPKSDPIEELAFAIARPSNSTGIAYILRKNPTMLLEQIEVVLSDDKEQRFVLLIDQFEELFIQTKDVAKRERFIDVITSAVEQKNSRLVVIIAMRSDFIAHCADYPKLNKLLNNDHFHQVGVMSVQELANAITKPATKVGADIDQALVKQIIEDMNGEPGALPLMSFALRDLFNKEKSSAGEPMDLTLPEYEAIGGLDNALERHAKAVFESFTDEQELLAKNIFSKLIEIGQGRMDTRRTATLAELVPVHANQQRIQAVVDILAQEKSRLIIQSSDSAIVASQSTVTLAHEKLITAWPWLRKLVDDNREKIQLQNQINDDARAWKQQQDEGFLYRGGRLLQVEEVWQDAKLDLDELSVKFIETSIRQQRMEKEKEEARRHLEAVRLRIAAAIATLLAIIAITATIFSLSNAKGLEVALEDARSSKEEAIQKAEEANFLQGVAEQNAERAELNADAAATAQAVADDERKLAEDAQADAVAQAALATKKTSELLAAQAIGNMPIDPELALLLSVAAFQEDPTASARTALLRGLQLSARSSIEVDRVLTDLSSNSVVAYTPDHNSIVIGTFSGSILFFDAQSGVKQSLELVASGSPIVDMAFDSSGALLVTLSEDRMVRLWKWGEAPSSPVYEYEYNTQGMVAALATSPVGPAFATGGQLSTIGLWTLNGTFTSIETRLRDVQDITYSPDGGLIAVVGDKSGPRNINVVLVNPLSAEVMFGTELDSLLRGHEAVVTTAEFSADGLRLFTGDENGLIIVWDTRNGSELARFEGNDTSITSLSVNEQWQNLAAGLADGKIVVWDIESRVIQGDIASPHRVGATDVVYHPAGNQLVSVSANSVDSIVLWSVGAEESFFGDRLSELPGPVHDIAPLAIKPLNLDVLRATVPEAAGYIVSFCATLSCNQGQIAIVGEDGMIKVEEASPILLENLTSLAAATSVTDSFKLLAQGVDGSLYVIDASPSAGSIEFLYLGSGVTSFALDQQEVGPNIALVVDGRPYLATISPETYPSSADFVSHVIETGNELPLQDSIEVQFSNDQKWLAVRTNTKLEIYEVSTTERLLAQPFSSLSLDAVAANFEQTIGEISAMVFSNSNDFIVLGDTDGNLFHIPLEQGVHTPRHYRETMPDGVAELIIVDDGSMLIGISGAGELMIFDTNSGVIISRKILGHSDDVTTLAASATGEWFVSGSMDQTLRIWHATSVDWAETACLAAERNFTAAEWRSFFGELSEYEQTCEAFEPGYTIH